MAYLYQIKVTITTGRDRGAGTDGHVYLGLAGREYLCDTSSDDFENGSTRDYLFGLHSNINNEHDNDPNKPPLNVADVAAFPAYIRFAQGGNSPWLLADAKVYVNDAPDPVYVTPIDNNPIWLGDGSGCIYYFRKPKPK